MDVVRQQGNQKSIGVQGVGTVLEGPCQDQYRTRHDTLGNSQPKAVERFLERPRRQKARTEDGQAKTKERRKVKDKKKVFGVADHTRANSPIGGRGPFTYLLQTAPVKPHAGEMKDD